MLRAPDNISLVFINEAGQGVARGLANLYYVPFCMKLMSPTVVTSLQQLSLMHHVISEQEFFRWGRGREGLSMHFMRSKSLSWVYSTKNVCLFI